MDRFGLEKREGQSTREFLFGPVLARRNKKKEGFYFKIRRSAKKNTKGGNVCLVCEIGEVLSLLFDISYT